MDKKKILAILVFLLMGFFMFTFANPSNNYEVQQPITDEVIEEQEEANNETGNEENNEVQNNVVNPIVGYNLTVVNPIVNETEPMVEDLTAYKNVAKLALSEYAESLGIKNQEALEEILNNGNNNIDNGTSRDAIDKALQDAKDLLDELKSHEIAPTIVLNGDSNITLQAGVDSYTELNATATDNLDGTWIVEPEFVHYRDINGDFDYSVKEVDTTKVGTYKIQYSCTDTDGNACVDANRADHAFVIRTVIVEDTTAPTITLNGEKYITLEAGVGTYTEENATAIDTIDGTWTVEPEYIHYSVNGKFIATVDKVDTTKPGLYKINYSCTDTAGNACVDANRADHAYVIRFVTVQDTTAPTIELNGAANITLEAGIDTYTELNATATDAVDGTWTVEKDYLHYRDINGKLDNSVKEVDTTRLGEYKIVYKCTDSNGNVCVDKNRADHDYVMRIVKVVDTTAPIIELNGAANITLEAGVDEYVEFGATVTDNVEPTITNLNPIAIKYYVDPTDTTHTNVVDAVDTNVVGTYKLIYIYKDASKNQALDKNNLEKDFVMRTVTVVDTTAPIIELNGAANITLEAGVDEYVEFGATVTDNVDPVITNLNPIAIKYYVDPTDTTHTNLVDAVDTNVVGTYKLIYIYKDASKNQALDKNNLEKDFVMRTVTVVDTIDPVITGVTENAYYNTDVTFGVEDSTAVTVLVDGQVVTDYTISTEGKHTIEVVDAGENTATLTFTIDKTAPRIIVKEDKDLTVGSIEDKVYSKVSFQLRDNVSFDKIYLNDTLLLDKTDNDWGSYDNLTVNSKGAKEGENVFTLVDTAGNSTDYVFKFDTIAPVITVITDDASKTVGNVSEDVYSMVSFNLYDNIMVDKVYLNGELLSDANYITVNTNGAKLGDNTLTLVDVAGNSTDYKFKLQKQLEIADLGSYTFEDKEFTYNGGPHDLVVTNYPEWVEIRYVNNAKVNVQTAVVTAVITAKEDSNYTGTVKITATMTIVPKQLEISDLTGIGFEDKEFTYNGGPHDLVVTNYPEWVEIRYVNNAKVNVQTAVVTARIIAKENSNYTGSVELKATMIINPKQLEVADLGSYTFEDEEFTYDGNVHSLAVDNLPDWAKVAYTNNDKTAAGTYEVTAIVTANNSNYTGSVELKATMTIVPKQLEEADLGSYTFEDEEFTYDGNVHSLAVDNLPDWAKVAYTNNDKTAAGTYEVTAIVTANNNNYTGSVELIATMKITDNVPPIITMSDNGATTTIRRGHQLPTFIVSADDSIDGDVSVSTKITFLRPYGELDGVSAVEVSRIDTGVVGTYTITYTAVDSNGNTATASRVVIVDQLFNSDQDMLITPYINGEYYGYLIHHSVEVNSTLPTFTATVKDLINNRIFNTTEISNNLVINTSNINMNKVGKYEITFTSNDWAGNTRTIARNLYVVDTTKPVITLSETETTTVKDYKDIEIPIATVTDNYDNNVTVTTKINTTTEYYLKQNPNRGFYKKTEAISVEYTAKDSSGNETKVVYEFDQPKLISDEKIYN